VRVTVLWVLAGAAVGAPVRYLIDRAVRSRIRSAFPWGTLAVNASGSFLLGLLVVTMTTLELPPEVMAGAGFGFCGALTTYSTFGYETLRLLESGRWWRAGLNVMGGIVTALAAVVGGAALGGVLWGAVTAP
jgi:fluoride exporter